EVLANAELAEGRRLYQELCGKCHKLYGEGGEIGPDLTGSNRNNLDYLLENIIAPSAVIDKDFRLQIVQLTDGRVLSGYVAAEGVATVTLQTQTEKLVLPVAEIAARKATAASPMPEGLLQNLSESQIRDLLAYLKLPSQVPLP